MSTDVWSEVTRHEHHLENPERCEELRCTSRTGIRAQVHVLPDSNRVKCAIPEPSTYDEKVGAVRSSMPLSTDALLKARRRDWR